MMVEVVTPGPRLKAPSLSLKAGSAGRCQETIPDHTIAQRAASPQAAESDRRSSFGDPGSPQPQSAVSATFTPKVFDSRHLCV
jgi:hypothetical protein